MWGELIPGDVINVRGGYPFLLLKKDGLTWTWINLSDGVQFIIEYQEIELREPHDHNKDFLLPRER